MDEIEKIRDCLKDSWKKALPELNKMKNKKAEDIVVELILEELVSIAVGGQEECASIAQILLSDVYRDISEKRKDDIISWILLYTEKNKEDSYAFFLGFNLVLKMKWKELIVKYIELYEEFIKREFDDDYVQFYGLEQYLK